MWLYWLAYGGGLMPDAMGKLTDEDKKIVVDWLTRDGRPVAKCPVCGTQQWTIGDHITQPITLGADNALSLFNPAPSYPSILVISVPCGYTMHINAVMAGLVKPAENPNG